MARECPVKKLSTASPGVSLSMVHALLILHRYMKLQRPAGDFEAPPQRQHRRFPFSISQSQCCGPEFLKFKMFFEGNLESGIGLALQQSKSIVCFARGEGQQKFHILDPRFRISASEPYLRFRVPCCMKLLMGTSECRVICYNFQSHISPSQLYSQCMTIMLSTNYITLQVSSKSACS